jgi:hypothetical protein
VIVTKAVDLLALHAELTAAGVALPRPLGRAGDDLHTYDAAGVPADLPAAAAPVVEAHNATATPAAVQATEDTASLGDLAAQYAAALTRLGQIADATTPTNAQVIQAVRDLATIQQRTLKALRAVVRRQGAG